MKRALYFLREGFKILLFHRRISLLAMGVVALTLFVAGLFFLITENLKGMEQHWKKQQKLTVYLDSELPEESRLKVERRLKSVAYQTEITFVDENGALKNFKETFPSLDQVVDMVGENPFSASYHVLLQPGHEAEIRKLSETLRAEEGVADVQYDVAWLKKLNSFVLFLRFVGVFFGLLLGVGAVVTVTNVVRMATLVHEDEIRILWLVGATPSYIRGPFMMQGILLGIGGGLLSLGMLYLAYHIIVHQVSSNFSILWNFLAVSFLPPTYILAILLAGFLCGTIGSFITLRG